MEKHPRCNKCKALLRFEKAYGQVPDRVTCLLCGWQKMLEVAVKGNEELRMKNEKLNSQFSIPNSKLPLLGTCPVCFRENIYIKGPKCSRCYKRIRLGRDVHAA